MAVSKVIIVGGGFSGISMAIRLLQLSKHRIELRIVEPRAMLGEGVAYACAHPDHRLNGPAAGHSVVLDDPTHLTRWCEANGLLTEDPDAVSGDGTIFIRRRDFARYLRDTLAWAEREAVHGSRTTHVRDIATGIERCGDTFCLRTARNDVLPSDMLFIATGNPPAALPAVVAGLRGTRVLIDDPFDIALLADIPRNARVLVLGTGLTAMDVVSVLVRQQHCGAIVMMSRRGLRPRPHSTSRGSAVVNLDRVNGPLPAYTLVGESAVRPWLRGLRQSIAAAQARGEGWHAAFDELRDVVWKLWPGLPEREKRRFHRTLRGWYDVHRFRVPPQTALLVRSAEESGQVTVRRGRIEFAQSDGTQALVQVAGADLPERFDVIVNATGFDTKAVSPFLRVAIDAGVLSHDPGGEGVRVDANCCALSDTGVAQHYLRVIGPPTASTFGDPLGSVFIGAHIVRITPDVLRCLAKRQVMSVTPNA